MTTAEMMFLLGFIILFIGVLATAFPRDRRYLTRLIHIEIPSFGLLLIMLALDQTIALATFVAVNGVAVFVFMRVLERTGAS
ncbi:MAG: EhaE family protein [Methanomicrobiales archaeon]|jgi:energy-converting hydrogenase A subunit E|nr:EhaE family protein [Methanomicrobiales archaeon]